jgi:hypothetical protein
MTMPSASANAAGLEWRGPINGGTPPELKAAICDAAARLCGERFGKLLEALVLAGSLACDEGTFVREGQDHRRALGDAEFLLIFKSDFPLPTQAVLHRLETEIESLLDAQGVTCPVRLNAVHPACLGSLRPHLYAFELRNCGQVIWGEEAILSLIPEFSPHEIPLEDAWRLLANRVVEQLSVLDQLVEWTTPSIEAHYRTVQLFLDMATSLLLFSGAYAPTCRERTKRLSTLARNARSVDEYPFSLCDFASHVEACTRWKLSPEGGLPGASDSPWDTAVVYAWLLWRWELARLTGAGSRETNFGLLRRYFELEPLRERWRGWRRVLRKGGWLGTCRHWLRWARLGWQASPEYWIYAAASELLFSLPSFCYSYSRLALDVDWNKVHGWLPLKEHGLSDERAAWRLLAANIVRNYREFVTGTGALGPLGAAEMTPSSVMLETQPQALPSLTAHRQG